MVTTHELDGGVFRVDRRDGSPWVARVFPRIRPLSAAEGDAEILRFVQRHAFPAERCVDNPVSSLDGSAVLVTEFVRGRNARGEKDPALLRLMGELLATLHSLPTDSDTIARPSGSWHSLSIEGGGRRHDVDVLRSLLADAAARASKAEVEDLERIRQALEALDVGDGLPAGLSHPDFVSANVIRTEDGDPVLVDWTGAGMAPRVGALGFLLATTGGDANLIDAVVEGYRTRVDPTAEELDRLVDSVWAFLFILDCWSIVYRGALAAPIAAKLDGLRSYGRAVVELTSNAFRRSSAA